MEANGQVNSVFHIFKFVEKGFVANVIINMQFTANCRTVLHCR